MAFTVSRCLSILAAIAIASPAIAQDEQTHFQNYAADYVLANDGSYVETRSYSIVVRKEQGIESTKHASISYSRGIQRAEVLEAYTTKADGRRVDAPKSNFQVTTNGGRGDDAPAFSDQATLSVVFPDLAVGDTVSLSYRVESIEPMFPRQFSVWETFPKALAIDHARIRFDYPDTLPLRLEPRGMIETAHSKKAGRQIVEWTLENPTPGKNRRTNFSVFDPESEPGVAASTFKSYADIATAYGARARPKAAVTKDIKQLADKIVPTTTQPRDTARLLYDWVATTITYGGNCIGIGAVVPHDLDFVLNNRMGDCKDHATLLEALLAAEGIASTQVLVNAGNVYKLPRLPVAAMVNHVITYIPSLDLYLDSTSNATPFGMLPLADQDKPALRVDGFVEGARTPADPVNTNSQTMSAHIRIASDGSFDGHSEVSVTGQFAISTRAQFRQVTKDADVDLVKNYYRSSGYVASGVVTRDDDKANTAAYKYGASFNVKNVLSFPGSGAFAITPPLFSDAAIGRLVSAGAQQADEPYDSLCMGVKSSEEYVYELPDGLKILSVPDDMNVVTDVASYRATYKVEGNLLKVMRVLDDRTPGNVCTPAMALASKQLAFKIAQNLRAQVLFK